MPSSGLCGYCIHMVHIHTQANTHLHKIKFKNKKRDVFLIMQIWGVRGGKKSFSDSLELELQVVVSHSMWVLGT